MTNIVVAAGANQSGDSTDLASIVQSSIMEIDQYYPMTICKISRMYLTTAVPAGSGPDFVNAVAVFESDLSSVDILQILHRVEQKFGRERVVRWGPRALDLDLLARGDEVLPDHSTVSSWMKATPVDGVVAAPSELILPHPRLHERAFVLVPAQDVAPDWVHPILRQSVSEMLKNLPEGDRESVKLLD